MAAADERLAAFLLSFGRNARGLGSGVRMREPKSPSRASLGSVKNRCLVFHTPQRGDAWRWECGNLAALARFPRGRGEEGETCSWFPTLSTVPSFPPPSLAAPSVKPRRYRGLRLAVAQQLGFGSRHFAGALGVAHLHRPLSQVRQADVLLQVFRRLRHGLQLLVWCLVILRLVLPFALAARIQADRRKREYKAEDYQTPYE